MSSKLLKNELKEATVDSIKRFSLKGIKTPAKAVSVYDGDTCDLVFHLDGKLVRYKCRLENLDAPELNEGIKGKRARNYLAHLCMGGEPDEFDEERETLDKKDLQDELSENTNLVYAVFGKLGKYGRPLVTLKTCPRGRSINKMMEEYVQSSESESSDSSEMDS